MSSAKHWIAIASKTVTGQYGSSVQFYSKWMISQISSVFLVHTLLCVESWSNDSWRCGSKWGSATVLGVLEGCKTITVCNANANSSEAARFHNSIFSTLQMPPPLQWRPGACSLRPLPAATAWEWSDILAYCTGRFRSSNISRNGDQNAIANTIRLVIPFQPCVCVLGAEFQTNNLKDTQANEQKDKYTKYQHRGTKDCVNCPSAFSWLCQYSHYISNNN